MIKAITKGNKIVQQNDISWSNLIRGNEALTQTKIKIIIHVLTPRIRPYNIPSINGSDKRLK